MIIQCDAHKTCLKSCPAKLIINLENVIPGSELYFFLSDPGSCYHNQHSDGKFREASIRRIYEGY